MQGNLSDRGFQTVKQKTNTQKKNKSVEIARGK